MKNMEFGKMIRRAAALGLAGVMLCSTGLAAAPAPFISPKLAENCGSAMIETRLASLAGKGQAVTVFNTTATLGEGYEYHTFIDAESELDFDRYIANVERLALYDTGVSAEYGDHLLVLSTCEYSQVNGRLVIVAKRVGEVEK